VFVIITPDFVRLLVDELYGEYNQTRIDGTGKKSIGFRLVRLSLSIVEPPKKTLKSPPPFPHMVMRAVMNSALVAAKVGLASAYAHCGALIRKPGQAV
jgi:hypothetical protein